MVEMSQTLAAAQAGDEGAFEELTLPLQRELHIHCYRMLGSLDDALQETLLRAWRRLAGFKLRLASSKLQLAGSKLQFDGSKLQLDRFEPRASFRAWLYRIATNVCLTMLARRRRRGEVALTVLKEAEPMHLDPYPDRLLDELTPAAAGPEAAVVQQESVELAFVAACQVLPPRQRATLLLRDVIGYSAAEVAPMLETTVSGVNSALRRAHANLERERAVGRVTRAHARIDPAAESALVSRLVDAWHAADVPSFVALLTQDALITMPPEPYRYEGREAIAAFLASLPMGGQLDRFRLVPTRANRQPAVAAYLRDGDAYRFYMLIVLAIKDGGIASLVRFQGEGLFERFGLPKIFTDEDGRSLALQ
jgi:RNA polymerase sigma-70 factor (ECF subfamily)